MAMLNNQMEVSYGPIPNPNHPATPHQVDDIVVELGRRDADAHDLCV